jgi:hypothetical protein
MSSHRRTGVALAVAVAVLVASCGGGGRRPPERRQASSRFSHSEPGAVAAATAWCQSTDQAFFTGGWDGAVHALALPAFTALAQREVGPASALARRRLAAVNAPWAVRIWPLEYATEQYSPTAARVRVWQLLAFGIQGPLDQTAFFSTTVSLRWTGATWRIASAPRGPDLTPPAPRAPAAQVATWVTAVDQLKEYRYAP